MQGGQMTEFYILLLIDRVCDWKKNTWYYNVSNTSVYVFSMLSLGYILKLWYMTSVLCNTVKYASTITNACLCCGFT